MRTARVSVGFMGLLLVATACGSGSSDPSGQGGPGVESEAAAVADASPQADVPPATGAAPDPVPAPEPADDETLAAELVVVPTALQFSAPLVGGGELDVSTLAGKPTIFWFWAPT